MILLYFKHGYKRTTHFMIMTLGKMTNMIFPVLKSLRFSGATTWNPIHKLGITKETSEFPSKIGLNNLFYWVHFEMVVTFLGDI